MTQLNCSDVVRDLVDSLEGELSPALVQQLEAHLCGCRDCYLVVDTTRKTIEVYRKSEPVPLPVEVKQRLQQALANKLDRRLLWALQPSP